MAPVESGAGPSRREMSAVQGGGASAAREPVIRRPSDPSASKRRHAVLATVLVAMLAAVAPITVAAPAAAQSPATLAGTISHAGSPLAVTGVWIYRADAQTLVTTASTDAGGGWTATVSPGSYRVMAWPSGASGLPATWYPNAPLWADAGNVTVAAGGSATVDVDVPSPAVVTGTVTVGGVPAAGVTVNAWWGTSKLRTTTTAADGTYSLTKLVPGRYKVNASSPDVDYAPRWYPSTAPGGVGAIIPTTAGATTAGISIDLPLSGQISGRVTTIGDAPVPGVGILVLGAYGNNAGQAITAADGTYRVTGLRAGGYKVQTFDGSFTWAGMTAPESNDFEGGAVYSVADGAETTGVDIRTYRPEEAPAAPYTGNAAGPRVAVLGDSITQHTTTKVHQVLDAEWSVSVRGFGGLRTDQLLPTAEKYALTDPDQVVINLGSNDAGQSRSAAATITDLQSMIDLFPGADCVHLVTITTSSSIIDMTLGGHVLNAAIRAWPATDPRVRVIDWSDALATHLAAGQPGASWTLDRIHPTGAGKTALATMVRDSLESCTPADGAVTGLVHDDPDADDVADPGEAPHAGALVTAWRDTNGDGSYDTLARTATSGADGTFRLADLAPATYRVQVDAAALAPGTPTSSGFDVVVTAGVGAAVDLGVQPEAVGRSRATATLGGALADGLRAVEVTPSGDIAIAGRFTGDITVGTGGEAVTMTSAGEIDGFVAVLAPDGQPRWAQRFGGLGADDLFGLAVGADGSVAVAGTLQFTGTVANGPSAVMVPASWDALHAVFDADGTLRWAKTANGLNLSIGTSVAFTPDGEIAAGTLFVDRVDLGDGFALETNGYVDTAVSFHDPSTGTTRRALHIGGANIDIVTGIDVLPDGRLLVAGMATGPVTLTGGGLTTTVTGAGNLDLLAATVDPTTAAPLGVVLHGSAGPDRAFRPTVDAVTGDIYLTGVLASSATVGTSTVAANDDAAVIALGPDLQARWVTTLPGAGSSMFTGAAAYAGQVRVVGAFSGLVELGGGFSRRAAHGDDGILVELDAVTGEPGGVEVLSGPVGSDSFSAVDHTADGAVVVAGTFVVRARVGVGSNAATLAASGHEDALVMAIAPT